MATEYYIQVPAYIYATITLPDGVEPNADMVFEAIGKYPEIKHGENFDADTFTILSQEDGDDDDIDPELAAIEAKP